MSSSSSVGRRFLRVTTLALLGLALTARIAVAESATLAWNANTESNLAGYRVLYGTFPGNYTEDVDVGNRTTFTVTDLAAGPIYYFVVKAYNTADQLSSPSNEVWAWVSGTIPPLPPFPTLPSLPSFPRPASPPATTQPPQSSSASNLGYFAEGVEADVFQTRFALLNPTDEPAAVVMVFEDEEGTQHTRGLELGPRTRGTVETHDLPELAGRGFSTRVESDAPVVVDRTVAWGVGRYGAHLETSLPTPSTRWYLTEGIAWNGLFDLFYLVHNPHNTAAEITVTYLLAGGQAPQERHYTVQPQSRLTIWVNREGHPLSNAELSAIVQSTNAVGVIAERALYLSGPGEPFMSGSASAGVTAPSTRWFFGEGATGDYFDLFLSLANPHDTASEVRATYLLPTGRTVERTYTLQPRSRKTVYVDREGDGLEQTSVSTILESTNGVSFLAERSMWWPGPTAATWYESHSTVGATETSTRWAVAEGEVGGAASTQTYLLVANTSRTAGEARVTLLFEDGSSATRTYALPAQSRTDIPVARDFPESENQRFGAMVESVGPTPAQLVVEHALYWNANGRFLSAGGAALASPLP
ncbi:MAG: hypothetical protein GEU99_01110 [Luteitalea sp.]|nr:hypothetical protein [Luteitalea sp.]